MFGVIRMGKALFLSQTCKYVMLEEKVVLLANRLSCETIGTKTVIYSFKAGVEN